MLNFFFDEWLLNTKRPTKIDKTVICWKKLSQKREKFNLGENFGAIISLKSLLHSLLTISAMGLVRPRFTTKERPHIARSRTCSFNLNNVVTVTSNLAWPQVVIRLVIFQEIEVGRPSVELGGHGPRPGPYGWWEWGSSFQDRTGVGQVWGVDLVLDVRASEKDKTSWDNKI